MPEVNKFFEHFRDHKVVIYLRNRALTKIEFEDYCHYVAKIGGFSNYVHFKFLDFEKSYQERLSSRSLLRLRDKTFKQEVNGKESSEKLTFIIDNMFKPLKKYKAANPSLRVRT